MSASGIPVRWRFFSVIEESSLYILQLHKSVIELEAKTRKLEEKVELLMGLLPNK